ncbi:MAG: hypothetical protein NVSMB51_14100 [Solirubrobacteraceae bacterium]
MRVLRPASGSRPARLDAGRYFSAEELRRARRFSRGQLALGLGMELVQGATCARAARRPHAPRGAGEAALQGAGLAAACAAAPLPLAVLARQRAVRAGLATGGWHDWTRDLLKGAAIEAALAGGGAALAHELRRRYGRRWWLPAAAASTAIDGALTWAAPVLLEPLFNDFTPLAAGDTRDDVFALAGAAGIRLRGVRVVDASRRTSAANAYVSGLGWTRRVVLYDTLLAGFTREETRLVVAHEFAHVRHRDVGRGLAWTALTAPAAMWAVAGMTDERGGSVAALALSLGLVATPLGVVSRRLSRAVEVRADEFALALAGNAPAFVSFERRVALQNMIDPDPPRWLNGLLGTHPSTLERIALALRPAAANRALRTPAGS